MPNATPLLGASASPPPAPGPSIAALPTANKPAMTYQIAPAPRGPASLADLQKSSMNPSLPSNR